jgi:hypothetical protein
LQSLADTLPQNLFAVSIIPYAGFLYHLTKSKRTPPLALFGFYFLLVFVFATIPAGIYGMLGGLLEIETASIMVMRGAVVFYFTSMHFMPPLCAAKQVYGTSLANVDWLHGTAESLLTVTNLLIGRAGICHEVCGIILTACAVI